MNVVVAAPEGHTLKEPEYSQAVDDLVAGIGTVPQIGKDAPLANPVEAADGQLDQVLEAAEKNGTPLGEARADARALSPLSADGLGRHHHASPTTSRRRRTSSRPPRTSSRR